MEEVSKAGRSLDKSYLLNRALQVVPIVCEKTLFFLKKLRLDLLKGE